MYDRPFDKFLLYHLQTSFWLGQVGVSRQRLLLRTVWWKEMLMRRSRLGYVTGCCGALVCVLATLTAQADQDAAAKSRTFRFVYDATLTNVPSGAKVRVWLPVPQSSDHQSVQLIERAVPARRSLTSTEPVYGNKIVYFETEGRPTGTLSVRSAYRVQRRELRGLAGKPGRNLLSAEERQRFLAPNQMVPIVGKPLSLLKSVTFSDDPIAIARTLYDRVDQHVRYDKSQPGYGNGDVRWVCDSRFGNCTDFHSLFISWARAKQLPARFEIGFPLPPQRGEGPIGGYHCWALFHTNSRGWVPVDISEADKHPELKEYYFGNLTENRVTFTTGRDLDLVPQQAGPPLNYFVYPYVEVDGQPWPKENIQLAFSYADE